MSVRAAVKAALAAIVRAGAPVKFGDRTSLEPVSRSFGLDRGTPLDRYYIEGYLRSNQTMIRGRALEVGELKYLKMLGSRTETRSVLVPVAEIAKTNRDIHEVIVGDLSCPATLPEGRFDCFVCTQTLNVIYDVKAAVFGAAKLLAPGGILLGTVPGISQISRYDMERWGDYWRFTTRAIQAMMMEAFGKDVKTECFGNIIAAQAMLAGVALEDIPDRALLDHVDPDYQVIIGFRATKPLS